MVRSSSRSRGPSGKTYIPINAKAPFEKSRPFLGPRPRLAYAMGPNRRAQERERAAARAAEEPKRAHAGGGSVRASPATELAPRAVAAAIRDLVGTPRFGEM